MKSVAAQGGESRHARSPILRGWKEIAGHFGVSVRTAQLWEVRQNLPVTRAAGPRGGVSARIEELEQWRASGIKRKRPTLRKPPRRVRFARTTRMEQTAKRGYFAVASVVAAAILLLATMRFPPGA